MTLEDEQKIARKVMDDCSTGEPFRLETLEPQDLYNFTLAATLYKNPKDPIKLRPYQIKPAWRMIDSVVNNKGLEIIALISRQGGKTTGLPGAGLHFLSALPSIFEPMDRGLRAGLFGPKEGQADYAYDMYKWFKDTNFMHDYLGIKELVCNQRKTMLSNNVVIWCESASDNANIERLTLDVAFCEEAQKISDLRLLNSIYPMCAATNGTRVLTGNPTVERLGYFYRVSSQPGPNVFVADWQEVSKYSEKYATYVDKQRRKLGPESEEFLSQYALVWPSASSNFCTIEELIELRGGQLMTGTEEPVVIGCDPARIGDSTVMTIMTMVGKPHLCMWAEWQGDDWKLQSQEITQILESFPNIFTFNIDTLHGEGISDYLPARVPVRRVPMEKHIQSYMWIKLRNAIQNCRFTYPKVDDPERYRFEEQMTSLKTKYIGNLFKASAPSKRGYHDDYADSLALAWVTFAGMPEELDEDEDDLGDPIIPRKSTKRPTSRRPAGFRRPSMTRVR